MIKSKPKIFYRPTYGNRIGWEIMNWKNFFLTLSIGRLEIQINKWPKDEKKEDVGKTVHQSIIDYYMKKD